MVRNLEEKYRNTKEKIGKEKEPNRHASHESTKLVKTKWNAFTERPHRANVRVECKRVTHSCMHMFVYICTHTCICTDITTELYFSL